MKNFRALLVAILSFLMGAAMAAAPQPGLWWSPSESGRGYAIDSQGDTLVLTVFAYGYDGRMQWYYADGPLTADGTQWQGTLLKFDFGQPMNGAYRAPQPSGNDGPVFITFTSRTTGTITLPGGGSVAIQRQNFGAGNPPKALLGQWLFAYSIGSSTFGDRYNFSTVGGATSSGNGVAVDLTRNGAQEYQLSGSFAGKVVGFHFTSSGSVLDQYLWTFQLGEGRGYWVSPSTYNQYGMNVYKLYTSNGMAKQWEGEMTAPAEGRGDPPSRKARTIAEITAENPELGALASQMWLSLERAR